MATPIFVGGYQGAFGARIACGEYYVTTTSGKITHGTSTHLSRRTTHPRDDPLDLDLARFVGLIHEAQTAGESQMVSHLCMRRIESTHRLRNIRLVSDSPTLDRVSLSLTHTLQRRAVFESSGLWMNQQ